MITPLARGPRLRKTTPDKPTFEQLHQNCTAALKMYIDVLNEGCALLVRCAVIPTSNSLRLEVFVHRQRESKAHQTYTRARQRLWKAAFGILGPPMESKEASAQ